MQVGAYVRISHDLTGEAQGVGRQRQDCTDLAARRGWTITGFYEDNDLSAFQRKVTRPAFEQLLTDLASGAVAGLVAYDLDRLWRQPRDLERVIDVYDTHPALVFATVTTTLDLASTDGRAMARIMVAMANKASADTGRRVARKHLDSAAQGIPVGGARPFGWQDDKRTLHPIEAPLVADAARQVTAGVGLSTVATELRRQGVMTPRGYPMSRSTLQLILSNPRLVGWRTRHGQVFHTPNGAPVTGLWTPILTVPEWHALQDRLSNHRRPQNLGRRYLLSGWLRCGLCHAKLRGYPRQDGVYGYACAKQADGGCGRLSIDGAGTDRIVIALTLARLATLDLTAEPALDWPGTADLTDLEAYLAEISAAHEGRKVSGEWFWPRLEKTEQRIRELRRERARFFDSQAQPAPAALSPEEFTALPLARQQEIIRRALPVIEVGPATRRFAPFDPARLHLTR